MTPKSRGRDYYNRHIRDWLIAKTLPNIFPKYNRILSKQCGGSYMVVTGGVNVRYCTDQNKEARRLLKKLFTEDIDIKFVVLEEKYYTRVNEVRIEFVKEINAVLQGYVSTKYDGLLQNKIIKTKRVQNASFGGVMYLVSMHVASIVLVFSDNRNANINIIDTMILSPKTSYFNVYKRILKSSVPIPTEEVNGVLYGSCDYCYIDTFRMLIDKLNQLSLNPNALTLIKFYRYTLKFMGLYLLRNRIAKVSMRMNAIYKKAFVELQKLDVLRVQSNLLQLSRLKYHHKKEIIKVSELFTNVLQSTNLNNLIKDMNKQNGKINYLGIVS